jgi:hypothetical protein
MPPARRALLCAYTPTQLGELVRTASFLRDTAGYDVAFQIWLPRDALTAGIDTLRAKRFKFHARVLNEHDTPDITDERPEIPPAIPELPAKSAAAAETPDTSPSRGVVARILGRITAAGSPRAVAALGLEAVSRSIAAVTRPLTAAFDRASLAVARRVLKPLVLALPAPRTSQPRRVPRWLVPLAYRLVRALSLRWQPRFYHAMTFMLSHFEKNRAVGLRALDRERPDVIVIGEDCVCEYLSIVVEAWRRGIPAVVIPYTISTAREPAEWVVSRPEYEADYSLARVANRATALAFPPWTYDHEGRDILRLPAHIIWPLELLGQAPPAPWIYCNGVSRAVAVESPQMEDVYLGEGLPRERLRVTGALYHDILARQTAERVARRRALLDELGLPQAARLVVCAVPPNIPLAERPGIEFRSHREAVEFMLRPLAAMRDTVTLVSLHPTLPRESMRWIEELGVRISPRDVAELIPLADLYVACISATIRMAIICGVPVVNYDFLQFHYSDYDRAGGVRTLYSREDYRAELERMDREPAALDELAAKQRDGAGRWGFADGRCGERILALIDEVVARDGQRRIAPASTSDCCPDASPTA